MYGILFSVMGILLSTASAMVTLHYGGDAMMAAISHGQAASSVSAVAQVAQAVKVHDMQEPEQFEGTDLRPLVQDHYLTAIPRNPTGGGPIKVDDAGAGHVLVSMPLGTAHADRVCSSVRKQVSQRVSQMPGSAGPVGCLDIDGQSVVFAQS